MSNIENFRKNFDCRGLPPCLGQKEALVRRRWGRACGTRHFGLLREEQTRTHPEPLLSGGARLFVYFRRPPLRFGRIGGAPCDARQAPSGIGRVGPAREGWSADATLPFPCRPPIAVSLRPADGPSPERGPSARDDEGHALRDQPSCAGAHGANRSCKRQGGA